MVPTRVAGIAPGLGGRRRCHWRRLRRGGMGHQLFCVFEDPASCSSLRMDRVDFGGSSGRLPVNCRALSVVDRKAPMSLRLLGGPDRVIGAPPYLSWGGNPLVRKVNSRECIREFCYNRPRRRGVEYWFIGFDEKSRVV